MRAHASAADVRAPPPQVAHLVRIEVARMRNVSTQEQKPLSQAQPEQALRAISAWLLINLMRAEDVQARDALCSSHRS